MILVHPFEIFKTLNNELKTFNESLVNKPYIICRTKSDLKTEISSDWNDFSENILDISSISQEGLDKFVELLVKLLIMTQ